MNEHKHPGLQWVSSLAGNWVSIFGLALATFGLFAVICLIAIDFFHGFSHPYVGILTYLILPSFIWMGLVLTGGGVWLQRRRLKKPQAVKPTVEPSAWKNTRNLIAALACGFLFLMFSALGSYRAFQETESVRFCGALCHTVMKPEYIAYRSSPHARVRCTECHIGPGASWFVRSKISGLYQVYAVLTNNFPRPIPTPVQNLRPAQETCEQCHWPEKFYGSLELRRQFFLPDKENTPWGIRMLLHVGGGDTTQGPVGGIHWHMIVSNRIEYMPADETRQTIPWVRLTNPKTGEVTVYQSQDDPSTPEQKTQPVRVLDCIDCHNRPTHIFYSPYRALDVSLWLNRIDLSIPFIKVKAAEALVESSGAGSQTGGIDLIAQKLSKEYSDYQDQPKIRQAISETQRIFQDNFFPEMKTDWKARPDNIGHYIWRGCFRCHDGLHADKTGRTITNACNTCHTIIAQGTQPEQGTVNLQGLKFDHPGGEIPPGILCNECHSGAP
ncbi:MAG: NapC/NirT family cytochrome c [Syntrophobacteraceae bacterium]